jgi:hypothetical protein
MFIFVILGLSKKALAPLFADKVEAAGLSLLEHDYRLFTALTQYS